MSNSSGKPVSSKTEGGHKRVRSGTITQNVALQ
jgi:hypothetical protein